MSIEKRREFPKTLAEARHTKAWAARVDYYRAGGLTKAQANWAVQNDFDNAELFGTSGEERERAA